MSSEPIDIEKYHWDYIDTLSKEERQAIRQSHVERIKQGREVWNAWAKQVLVAIEQTYPQNATEAEKSDIKEEYTIDFSGVKFEKFTDFSGFIFPMAVNFINARFSGKADFYQATFSREADFSRATFSDRAFFGQTTFSGRAVFFRATFSDEAFFGQTTFSYAAYFFKATFSGETNFNEATFSGRADFMQTTFSGKANFRRAIFSDAAYFFKATFSDRTSFDKTTFSDEADFSEAVFSGEAYFVQATFSDVAYFVEAAFSGEKVSFLGAQFQQQSLFVDIKFSNIAKAIPCDFRQTYFHLPPSVDDFPSNLSQFIKANKSIKRNKEFYKACEAKFRALKQLAERNNHHQKTLEFYGCELYCQRRANSKNYKIPVWEKIQPFIGGIWCNLKNWMKKFPGCKKIQSLSEGFGLNSRNWVNYLYGLFSGYGLSLWRPFLFWLVVMLGSATLQACNDNKISPTASVNYERLGFYIAPSMPPFVGKPLYQKEVRHRLYKNKVDEDLNGQLPTFNRVVRFFQALITFITIFLFGLALRNRFKIG